MLEAGYHLVDTFDIDGSGTVVALAPKDRGASHIVESPDGPETSGSYTFGPVEYARADDGEPDVDTDAGDDDGDVDPWFAFGGGNSTTNRLWRTDTAAVESVGLVGIDI